MAITFNCGHCGKSLTTSDDKAGLKAKCPGCGEVITVPQSDDHAEAADAEATAGENDFESSGELPPAPAPMRKKASDQAGPKTCPMCGAENPRRARTCGACGEELPSDEEEPRRRRRGPRGGVEVGEVMSEAWETFKANFGMSLAAQIVSSVLVAIGFAPLIVLIVIIALMADQNQEPPIGLIIGIAPALLVGLCVVFYLMPGVLRFFIGIARQDPDVELSMIFKGGPWFLSYLVVSTLYGLAMLVAVLPCGIPALFLGAFVWPIVYVVCDSQPGEGNYWNRTLELTKPNWVTSLLLILIVAGINLGLGVLGAIPCIGAIISLMSIFIQPYFQLIWSTAYVKMSGQD